MNINDKNYQLYVMKQISGVFESGTQGVFLDTIDDIDSYPQLRNGTINFIKLLHKKFPGKFFIMNRGFMVLDEVMGSIQGMLFEDFGTYYNFSRKRYMVFNRKNTDWIIGIANKLKKYQDEGELRIIASGYAYSPFSPLTLYGKLFAKKYGFAFYCPNLDITEVWFDFLYPIPRMFHTLAE